MAEETTQCAQPTSKGLTSDQEAIYNELKEILNRKVQSELDKPGCNQLINVHHGAVVPTPPESSEAYPGIYIGNETLARDISRLQSLGITHVVNCAQGKRFGQVDTDEKYYQGSGIVYFGIPGHDSIKFDISKYFQEAAEFVKQCKEKVLVHCHQGISRSGAVAMACLMINMNMTATGALETILERRLIMPNNGFLKKLAVFQSNKTAENVVDIRTT